MDAPIGLFAPDGTTALLEFPHQAGMGCRAALHANQVPQSLLDPQQSFIKIVFVRKIKGASIRQMRRVSVI